MGKEKQVSVPMRRKQRYRSVGSSIDAMSASESAASPPKAWKRGTVGLIQTQFCHDGTGVRIMAAAVRELAI